MPNQANILFIFCDQFRVDCMSHMGHPIVQTPNIDALADDGISFVDVTTQCPLCVPARASLFTGRYPHQTGCINNGLGLWPEEENFVRSVRDAGYVTGNRGKLHLFWRHDNELLMSGPMLQEFGFDDPLETTGKCSEGRLRASGYSEHLRDKGLMDRFWADLWERVRSRTARTSWGASILEDEDDHIDAWVLNKSMDFIRKHKAGGKPFFLWAGPPGPHDPFDPPGKWASMYAPEDMDLPHRANSEDPDMLAGATLDGVGDLSDAEVQQMRALYYGNISFIDHKIGQIVQLLRDEGIYDTTWIIMSSDHGEMLGDFNLTAKRVFHRHAVNVPLVIKPPANVRDCPRGHISDALVELIDVGTTIREIAGGELLGDQGESLLPIISGSALLHEHRDEVHSSLDGRLHMLRSKKQKLIFTGQEASEIRALFDLEQDPDERYNLAADEGAVAGIRERIEPFFQSTKDRLREPWRDISPHSKWCRNPLLDVLNA